MSKIDVATVCARGGLAVCLSLTTACFRGDFNENKIPDNSKGDIGTIVNEKSVLDDPAHNQKTSVGDSQSNASAPGENNLEDSTNVQSAPDLQEYVCTPSELDKDKQSEKKSEKVLTYDDQKEILANSGYTYEKFLGKGGFGEVYKCKKKDGKSVAVKLCCHTEHPLFGEQVSREIKGFRCLQDKGIRSSKHLNVPNYMKIYPDESENTEGRCAMFELSIADGGDTYKYFCGLRRSIIESVKLNLTPGKMFSADASRVDYSELKRLARHVLKGLKILHENGLAHGDVALRNVLIDKKEDGKHIYSLGDFGLSAQSSDTDDPTRNFARDIERVGSMLFFAWRLCLCYDEEFRVSVDLDEINAGGFDSEYPVYTWNCRQEEGTLTLVGVEESRHKREKTEGEAAEFIAFIKRLVAQNPQERPTVEQALNDPYLKG